jgi:nitroimidazol reductase NimA-like FMN-containing flavoprotein (pyridoxamine 5'-phosphate oxidase superfamily)
MDSLSLERIVELLDGPHQAVLSVSRTDKGPIAVPISYLFDGSRFVMVTSPSSLHGRILGKTGRATLTIQYEQCDGRTVYQWYVVAEGPVAFTDENPAPLIRSILAKDRGEEHADEWTIGGPPSNVKVTELVPVRLSGYEFSDSLDTDRSV